MNLRPVLLAISLSACAQEPLAWPELLRPVPIYTSDALSENCQDNIQAAIDFWADHGVRYLVYPQKVEWWQPVVAGLPPRGHIGLRAAEFPSNQADLAVTRRWRLGQEIVSADIRFRDGECSLNTAAHELGHALGLDHVDGPENLMYPFPSGFELTDEQIEHVR